MTDLLARIKPRRGLVAVAVLVGLVLGLVAGARWSGIPLAPGAVPASGVVSVSHDVVAEVDAPAGASEEGYVSAREVARDVARTAGRTGVPVGDAARRVVVGETREPGSIEFVCFGATADEAAATARDVASGLDLMARGADANGDEFSASLDGPVETGWAPRAVSLVACRLAAWGGVGVAVGLCLGAALALVRPKRDDGSRGGEAA